MNSNAIISTIIVLAFICLVWWSLSKLFHWLLRPGKVNVISKKDGKSSGYIATPRSGTGETSLIIDESIPDNREVGHVQRMDKLLNKKYQNILLIDISGSTAGILDTELKPAAKEFIDKLDIGNEQIAVYGFSDELYRFSDLSNEKSKLYAAVDQMQPVGTTSLKDAVLGISDMIDNLKDTYSEKEVVLSNIIMFTDGQDNTSKTTTKKLKEQLKNKTLFIVCSDDADTQEMIELVGNPTRIYYLGTYSSGSTSAPVARGSANPPATLPSVTNTSPPAAINAPSSGTQVPAGANASGINTGFINIRDAFADIRSKLPGRGSVAYVRLKDPDNPEKNILRGFVNEAGEIYFTGPSGEGSRFLGLCRDPNTDGCDVYCGNYINVSSGADYQAKQAGGRFGKNTFMVSPIFAAGGAFVLYDKFKEKSVNVHADNLFVRAATTVFFSALLWLPLFLIYWAITKLTTITVFPWLGEEIGISVTLYFLFLMVWFIMNNLWVSTLRRNDGFSNFINAINRFTGLKSYSWLIAIVAVIGVALSVTLLPYTFLPLFGVIATAIIVNLTLGYGGGEKWFVEDPAKRRNRILSAPGKGDPKIIDWTFTTVEEELVEARIDIKIDKADLRIPGDDKKETDQKPVASSVEKSLLKDDFLNAVDDQKSKNYIKFIADSLVNISVEKGLLVLDEQLMVCGITAKAKVEEAEENPEIKKKEKERKELIKKDKKLYTPAETLYNDRNVSPLSRLALVAAILKEEVIETYVCIENEEIPLLGIQAGSDNGDSPWVQKILNEEKCYIFMYSQSTETFVPVEKKERNVEKEVWLAVQ